MKRITQYRILQALSHTALGTRVLMVAVLAGVLTSACDVHGITAPGTLVSMTVTPNATLTAGSTQQMTAVGYDADGRVVPVSPTWTVAAGGGTIASTGIFTAGATPGLFAHTVVASVGSISANASITVIPGPLASIVVTPTPVTLAVTNTQQFIAVGKDAVGNIVPFTPTWSVVAGGGAVDGNGVFTAGTVSGTYANTVQASSGGLKGTATVTVTPGPLASITVTPNPDTLAVGLSQQFTATGVDASGNVVVLTPVWSVVAGGGTIGNAGLFVAGTTLGTFTKTVTATSGGLSGTATVVVTAGPLATITVTPNPISLVISTTQQFTAVGKDVGGNVVAIVPTWSVVAGGGTINLTTGLFTAGVTTGTFTNSIRANVGGLAGFATVLVTNGPLANITVTPNPVFMQTNATQQFVAVGKDLSGNVFLMTPVWSVAAGGGTIDPATGLFTAGVLASTFNNTITATFGAISGTATVTVSAPAPVLTTITVSPDPVSVQANGTMQFAAVGRDGGGVVFPISPTWSVVAGGGSIDHTTGLFTAGAGLGAFVHTIEATSGAVHGFATVTVTAIPPVLSTIVVSPNPASVQTGGTQQFGAVGRDGLGNIFPTSFVWSIDPLVGGGTIDINTGVFTAGAAAGSFANTVRATSGVKVGKATVNVTAPAPFVYVDLGLATPDGILGATAVSCATNGTINANVSIWPGNALGAPCTVSGLKTLGVAPADQEQVDMKTAFDILMGKPCPAAHVIADIGGTTKTAGVYCTAGAVLGITGAVTLDGGGDNNAVFVFQSPASSMTTAGSVILQNGAHARNVYWVIGTSATLGTASAMQGNILANASISLIDNSTLVGRALAHTGAVSLTVGNTINLPPLSP
jgi:hypothetical protein